MAIYKAIIVAPSAGGRRTVVTKQMRDGIWTRFLRQHSNKRHAPGEVIRQRCDHDIVNYRPRA